MQADAVSDDPLPSARVRAPLWGVRRRSERKFRGSRRIPAWLQALGLLAAALIAGQHALPSLHHGLVQHEVCADHGELVHAGEAHAAADPSSVPALEAEPAPDLGHDHCGTTPSAPTRAPLAPEVSVALAPTREEAAASRFQTLDAAPADVLAFAPKQSPPV